MSDHNISFKGSLGSVSALDSPSSSGSSSHQDITHQQGPGVISANAVFILKFGFYPAVQLKGHHAYFAHDSARLFLNSGPMVETVHQEATILCDRSSGEARVEITGRTATTGQAQQFAKFIYALDTNQFKTRYSSVKSFANFVYKYGGRLDAMTTLPKPTPAPMNANRRPALLITEGSLERPNDQAAQVRFGDKHVELAALSDASSLNEEWRSVTIVGDKSAMKAVVQLSTTSDQAPRTAVYPLDCESFANAGMTKTDRVAKILEVDLNYVESRVSNSQLAQLSEAVAAEWYGLNASQIADALAILQPGLDRWADRFAVDRNGELPEVDNARFLPRIEQWPQLFKRKAIETLAARIMSQSRESLSGHQLARMVDCLLAADQESSGISLSLLHQDVGGFSPVPEIVTTAMESFIDSLKGRPTLLESIALEGAALLVCRYSTVSSEAKLTLLSSLAARACALPPVLKNRTFSIMRGQIETLNVEHRPLAHHFLY